MGKQVTISLDGKQAEKLERFAASMKESPDDTMAELVTDALEQVERKGIDMSELLQRCLANMEEEAGPPHIAAVFH